MFFIKCFSLFTSYTPFTAYLLATFAVAYLNLKEENVLINSFLAVFSLLLAIQIVSIFFLKSILKRDVSKYKGTGKEGAFETISRERSGSLNFLLSNVFSMAVFDLDSIPSIVFVVTIFVIIAIMYFKNNIFMYNPFLEMSGIKIFSVNIKINNEYYTKTLITTTIPTYRVEYAFVEYIDDIIFYSIA